MYDVMFRHGNEDPKKFQILSRAQDESVDWVLIYTGPVEKVVIPGPGPFVLYCWLGTISLL